MVKKDELIIGNQYYVPSYSGVEKVALLSVDGDFAIVQTKNSKPFYRKLQYLFIDHDAAKQSKRSWESGRRKGKKKKK